MKIGKSVNFAIFFLLGAFCLGTFCVNFINPLNTNAKCNKFDVTCNPDIKKNTKPLALANNNGNDLSKFKGIPFKNEKNDFNGEQARNLAMLIGSAYDQFEKQGKQDQWSIPNGFELITELTHNKKKKIFGFVAKKVNDKNEKEAFIIIRGTRTAYEWYNNTAIKYDKYISVTGKKWGVTTKGFYSIYIDLRDEIKAALPKLKNADRIFIAGHSLGGALATLTIPDLIDSGIPASKIIVYTFASPRCGDRELANGLNNSGVKHWRIANTEDIVPTLPGATANIFSTNREVKPEEVEKENFILKTYNDLKEKGMKTLGNVSITAGRAGGCQKSKNLV